MTALKNEISSANSLPELADLAFAVKESHKYVDDARKELDKALRFAERITCILWSQFTDGGSIHTSYCTAVPAVRMMASLPKRGAHPSEFFKLMAFLGVPAELYEGEVPIVTPYFPGMVEYLSSRLEQGLPLPEGITTEKTYPVYSLKFRRRKEVADLSDIPELGGEVIDDAKTEHLHFE